MHLPPNEVSPQIQHSSHLVLIVGLGTMILNTRLNMAEPCNILDLPNELLVKIFGLVDGGNNAEHPDPEDFTHDTVRSNPTRGETTDIQHARLVCHRFCNISSQFFDPLFRCVEVTPNPASLARLEGISRHPTISKAVVCVRVVPEHYWYPVDEFKQIAIKKNEGMIHKYNCDSDQGDSRTKAREIEKARRMVKSWKRHKQGVEGLASQQAQSDLALLQQLCEEYEHILTEAQACLDHTFLPTIIKSLAKLPRVLRLKISDKSRRAYRKACELPGELEHLDLETVVNDPALFIRRRFFSPCVMWPQRAQCFVPPPVHLLHQLPLEIQKTVALRHLHINLVGMWDWAEEVVPTLNPHQTTALEDLANDLESFEYSSGCPEHVPRIPGVTQYPRYLKTPVLGKQLQTLKLYLKPSHGKPIDEEYSSGYADLSPVFHSQLSPKLQRLELRGCAFTFDALETILAQYGPKSQHCYFERVRLLSGSWAGMLDLLREKANANICAGLHRQKRM